MNLLNHIVIS